jgi:hypothetical protein
MTAPQVSATAMFSAAACRDTSMIASGSGSGQKIIRRRLCEAFVTAL